MEQATPGELHLARLSVAQYHAMLAAGILRDGAPVELVDGLLVTKMTKNPPHATACKLLAQELARVLSRQFHLQVQGPITTDDSEPEPDLAVVRGQPRDYLTSHPGPADVALVVEVADDSLARDRGLKLRAYARAGVPEYWIVNLRDRAVEVYTEPHGEEYARRVDHGPGERLALESASTASILVDDVLP